MPKIIKAHMVSFDEEHRTVDVPERSDFTGVHVDFGDSDEFYDDSFEEAVAEEVAKTPEELLEEAKHQAEEILKEAKATAGSIIDDAIEQAQSDAEAILENAKQKGYDHGYDRGVADSKKIIEDANKTLREAQKEKELILRQIEPDAVSLIIKIVEKLAGDLVSLNPAVILHLIRVGLANAPAAKELAVRVSPAEYDAALTLKSEVFDYVDSDTSVSIIKDNSLKPGGCVIDTPVGSINSSLDTQWAALKQDLIQLLKASV